VPFLGGIGKIPAIVALTLYTLLPIVLNTYLGITKVDPELKLAGLSLGMTDGQILRYIELPLARAMILGGVRIATVIAIGVATIARSQLPSVAVVWECLFFAVLPRSTIS